ncbi:hypothetical protein B7R21_17630 [Subtercola boreus]|uniref:Glycosyltransferase RgtA/B/C/D-like domain-containing protein n=1 Tax=Subtercola boreus TaxID=120213 RepID=A0A3E0VBC4_9MICO|nr:hypothetical protein [Subtercola boreus]RFA06935.1 hypothetical protein B7R21_17630 [Subtercola boreus]
MIWLPRFRTAMIPAGILLLYLTAALTTLLAWQNAGFTLTGDEPHYLVIARGILVDHTLEQTVPYREAFEQGLFFGGTIAEAPTPANTHAYLGPHGLFNIHSFGLPLLIAVPYALQGVLGVKVFLVLVGGAALLLFWKISGVFMASTTVRAVSVAAVGLGMPLLPGANQIFPDIPAGVLCLVGLYWLLTATRSRPVWREALMGVAVGYLPLLQIKFALPALILAAALAVAIVRREHVTRGSGRSRRWGRAAVIVMPVALLLGLLFAVNLYAFSNLTGPYEPGAFDVGPAALMAFAGLAIDQNQGIVFQSPIAFAGLVGVGLLVAARRRFALVWALVLLALIVPNALLANEYGGYSLNGRFQYAGALVFGIATLFALGLLAERRRVVWMIVCAIGVALSAAFWAVLTFSPTFLEFGGRLLYRQDPLPWLLNYSVFFFPLQNALPALYDESWASAFLPNYVWAAVVLMLLLTGFAAGRGRLGRLARPAVWMPVAAGLSAAVLLAGLTADSPAPTRHYRASELVVLQGEAEPGGVSASAATGQTAGPFTEGPITLMRAGSYTLTLTYTSTAPTSVVVGSWQPVPAHATAPPEEALTGTAGAEVTVSRVVELENIVPATLQLRTNWNGTGQLTVQGATYAVNADG